MIDHQSKLKAAIKLGEAVREASWNWINYPKMAFNTAMLVVSLGIEYEIVFRTFNGIAGANSEYWSPAKMALSSGIVLAAYHCLGKDSHDSLIAKMVRIVTPWMIGAYTLGLGLLVSGVISIDTIPILLSNPADIVIGELPTGAPEQPWLQSLFSSVMNPTALLLFSLGIGGLAITNLFLASQLIDGLKRDFRKLRDTKSKFTRVKADYLALQAAEEKYNAVKLQLHALSKWTPGQLLNETALQISVIVQDNAAKHRRHLKGLELSRADSSIALTDPVDHKVIERDLKRIEAFDLKTIIKILKTHLS